jgi:hypothetical protein
MSRWPETFAELSGASDTVDTPRHNAEAIFLIIVTSRVPQVSKIVA